MFEEVVIGYSSKYKVECMFLQKLFLTLQILDIAVGLVKKESGKQYVFRLKLLAESLIRQISVYAERQENLAAKNSYTQSDRTELIFLIGMYLICSIEHNEYLAIGFRHALFSRTVGSVFEEEECISRMRSLGVTLLKIRFETHRSYKIEQFLLSTLSCLEGDVEF